MNSTQAIHELMVEIGPILDLQQVTEYAEDSAWLLVCDDETRIDAEYDQANERLMLTGDVAVVAEHARAKVYEALLQYNYLWTEHGGVRAALDASQGMVVLMFELQVAALDISRLSSVLLNVREVVEGWRRILASIEAGGDGADVIHPAPGMVRV